jgi:proteasome activator subunit 4
MFVVAAVQYIKIGDLTAHPSGLSYSSEDEDMQVDRDYSQDPDMTPVLSKEEERSLVRDSTASFAGDFCFHWFIVISEPLLDWVTLLVRRILALYENLPEEGGKKNTTGGKQEESMLKSIKSMMDVVCLHLSDQLFDLILNLLFDYAMTNAKSNAVQAFGQLIACLARVKPEQTMAKFLSPCISQVEEELKHGASGVRTTSMHVAVPSDTTLHWSKSFPLVSKHLP